MSETESQLQAAYKRWANAKTDHQRDRALRELLAAGRLIIGNAAARHRHPDHPIEDLRQEAHVAVWRALPNYRPELGNMSAFVALVARRELATYTMRNNALIHVPPSVINSGEKRLGLAGLSDGDGDLDEEVTMPPALDNVERDVLRLLLSAEIREYVCQIPLTPRERQAIELRYLGSTASYAEICAATGLCEKQVDNDLVRAMGKLRAALTWERYLEMSGGIDTKALSVDRP